MEVKNILVVGFGGDDVKGGLAQVMRDWVVEFDEIDTIKFLVFGSKRVRAEKYEEISWIQKNYFSKVLCLIWWMFALPFMQGKVIIHGSPVLYAIGFLKRSNVILYHHGVVAQEFRNSAINFNFQKKIMYTMLYYLEYLCLFWYPKHICYNKDILSRLQKLGKDTLVLPNFVCESVRQKRVRDEIKTTFVSAGFWVKRKRIDRYLNFFNRAGKCAASWHIYGPVHQEYCEEFFDTLAEIQQSVTHLQVKYFGEVEHRDLHFAMANSSYFLHLADAEGFPKVVQEAQVNGCVIIGDENVLNEIFLDRGFINFENFDLSQFTNLEDQSNEHICYYENLYDKDRILKDLREFIN